MRQMQNVLKMLSRHSCYQEIHEDENVIGKFKVNPYTEVKFALPVEDDEMDEITDLAVYNHVLAYLEHCNNGHRLNAGDGSYWFRAFLRSLGLHFTNRYVLRLRRICGTLLRASIAAGESRKDELKNDNTMLQMLETSSATNNTLVPDDDNQHHKSISNNYWCGPGRLAHLLMR